MPRISEIDTQIVSTLICNYLICKGCGVIDRDFTRARRGHRCTTCKIESESGHLVFPINIHVLVDLVQQAFHSESPTQPLDAPQGQDIGTVLYYCTLREALLNSFLLNHLRSRQVPAPLVSKMLDDNKLASQKFGGLFTAVVGVKWVEAVASASQASGYDFKRVSDLMKSAAELRNEFLHEGRAWAVTREFATECVDSMGEMVHLFVILHNEYIHPHLLSRATA